MRVFIRVLLAVVVLIVLLVGGLATYLATMDPNEHKARIASLFEEQTGLELQLEGDLGLTLYPWLGVSANAVTVANPPGFEGEPLATVDAARLRIRLLPLLRGRYEVDTLQVHGASLNLITSEEGQTNWQTLTGQAPERPETGTEGQWLAGLVVGGVDVRNGRIRWDDRSDGQLYVLRDITMTTGSLVYGEPVAVDVSLVASARRPELQAQTQLNAVIDYGDRGQRFDISPVNMEVMLSGPRVPDGNAAVNLDTNVTVDLAQDTLRIAPLDINGLGMQFTASVDARNIQSSQPAFQADVSLAGDDLALLLEIAELDDLAQRVATLGSRSFDISASASADMTEGTLDIPSVRAGLLGAAMEGRLNASGLDSGRYLVNGELDATGPDLPLLLEVAGRLQGGDNALVDYGQQLSNAANRRFSARTEFDVNWQQADIDVPVLQATSLGMELDGRLMARDMRSDNGTVDGHLRLTGDAPATVLNALNRPQLAGVLRSLEMEAEVSGGRRNLSLGPVEFRMALAGADIPDSPVNVRLQTASEIDLEQGRLTVDYLTLSGWEFDVDSRLEVSGLFDAPRYSGQLYVAPFNLRAVMNGLGLPLPDTTDPSTLQRLSLDTVFAGTTDSIDVQELTWGLDDSLLTGQVSVTGFRQPSVEFLLEVDQIDMDRYLSPASADGGDVSAGELPFAVLAAPQVQGELNVGRLTLSGMRIAALHAAVDGRDRVIRLAPLQASLYEGSYQGDISLDATGETPALALDSRLEGVALGLLLRDLLDSSYLSGMGDVQLSVQTRGDTVGQLKANLGGSGSLSLTDGVLQGVDIGAVLAQLETIIRSRRLASIDRGESTAFETFSATLDISQGVVRSNDLLLTAPGFRVSGRGQLLDLVSERIDYRLDTVVDTATATRGSEEYDIGGYTLPIACSGTLNAPRCVPDVETLLRRALGEAIEQRLGDFLQRTFGNP